MPLPIGKLPHQLLAELLARIPHRDPRVLIGGRIGEDAAVLDLGDHLLVAKTDPITFATDRIGWYAVHINANDIACMGAVPRWFLASALLPARWTEADVGRLFDQLIEACGVLGVELVGGHTEVTEGLDRPIVVGCMLGEVARDGLVTTSGAQPGDDVLLTQGIAIEGTAVLAREAATELSARGVPDRAIARAQQYIFEPGISVVRAAATVCATARPGTAIHSLHDPTEGGLAAALAELAAAAGVGLVIRRDAIPVLPETQAICEALDLDPFGLLASGALLVATASESTPTVLSALATEGIPAALIGRVRPAGSGLWLETRGGRRQPLPAFARDELARYFEEH